MRDIMDNDFILPDGVMQSEEERIMGLSDMQAEAELLSVLMVGQEATRLTA